VHTSIDSPHSDGPGSLLPAPGIRGRTSSMSANHVHRQQRPGLRRTMRRLEGRVR
jgi:hypothetical protein